MFCFCKGGQPQVFLAMQTTNIGQDSQGGTPYITLQPVSVDGELTSSTLVQEGVNLQQAVMPATNSGANDGKEGTQQQVRMVFVYISFFLFSNTL